MLGLTGQTLTKGSSLFFDASVNLPESLKDGRVSAYIKIKRSDAKAITIDAEFNTSKDKISIVIPASKSISLPVGRAIYFIEISKGVHKIVESEYLLVEP